MKKRSWKTRKTDKCLKSAGIYGRCGRREMPSWWGKEKTFKRKKREEQAKEREKARKEEEEKGKNNTSWDTERENRGKTMYRKERGR